MPESAFARLVTRSSNGEAIATTMAYDHPGRRRSPKSVPFWSDPCFCVAAQAGRLKLFILPPYSPHLNPDEQVWGNVKGHVAKQTVANKFDLTQKLQDALERLRALPQIIANFFRHPHCRYILDADAAA